MGISLSTFSPISRPLWVHCQLSAARYYQVLSVEATWVWRWTTWSIAGLRANCKVTLGDIIPNSFFGLYRRFPLFQRFARQCNILFPLWPNLSLPNLFCMSREVSGSSVPSPSDMPVPTYVSLGISIRAEAVWCWILTIDVGQKFWVEATAGWEFVR